MPAELAEVCSAAIEKRIPPRLPLQKVAPPLHAAAAAEPCLSKVLCLKGTTSHNICDAIVSLDAVQKQV